jgi:glycosyltransferase involved in cell wall biosynthesis
MPSFSRDTNHKPPRPTTDEPLVSVVTPVHNTADYLSDCICSVLAQSYQAWEYVIVNNASTDGSREIAQSFAAQDSRIRIVDTDRLLPQIQNYNFALRQITPASRYCKMVQADDWIYPNCLQEMVALAQTDPEIAIVGAYRLGSDSVFDRGLYCQGPENTKAVVPGRDACRRFFLDRAYLFGSPSTLLYSAGLVRSRNHFFLELESGYFEDAELCFEVLDSRKFGFIHQILSCTRSDNLGITSEIIHFNIHHLMRYVVTKRYGSKYLNSLEFHECLSRAEDEYYRMLALSLFKGRGSRFWQYHVKGLEISGQRLDWGRVVRLQLPRLLNLVGNPKRTLDGVWEQLRSTKLINRIPRRQSLPYRSPDSTSPLGGQIGNVTARGARR